MDNAAFIAEIDITSRLCANPKWRIMRDVLIPAGNGTCQIDFLILTNTCVFVGEIKTFHGLITGKGDRPYWKQYLSKRTVYEYYNPSFQNQKHVKYLQRFLYDFPLRIHLHSIIIMVGLEDGRISLFPPYLPNTSVVSDLDALNRIVDTIGAKNLMSIDEGQIQQLFDFIGNRQIRGQAARQAHIGYVQQVRANQETQLAWGLCPQCGGQLVQRQGKYGPFWGCSNYPQCKYTRQL